MTFLRPISKPRKSDTRWRSPGHLNFVRGHHCIVSDCNAMPIEAAHVRLGLPAGEQAGMAQKPGDEWAVPMCGGPEGHHAEQHRIGEASFAKKYSLDLVAAAQEFFAKSPHRHKHHWSKP